MSFLVRVTQVLPWFDWLALTWFFAAWWGYAAFARRRGAIEGTLLSTSNAIRRRWMVQATLRENRMLDGVVVQSMSNSSHFFASTTILIIGGLVAALGAGDKAFEMFQEIPFATRTSALVLDLKLLVLTGVYVFAFFRFSWSMRQYSFGALLIGAAPSHPHFQQDEAAREAFGDHAGQVMGLAAETFNDGLRAIYMSFAVVLLLMSPLAFAVGTAGVLYVLYQREFHSEVLALLRRPLPPAG